jgi:hypothetical protein
MKRQITVTAAALFLSAIISVSKAQVITTIAGSDPYGFSGDGGLATAAKINHASKIITDHSGNIYFTDSGNNRVRQMSSAGLIKTIAGTGVAGYTGDGGAGTSADLSWPAGLALDASERFLYIGDVDNARVRKLDLFIGTISTVAGNGSFIDGGDGGPASAASFSLQDIAMDLTGNLLIATTYTIRRVNASTGIITTIAGGGGNYPGDGGDAALARFDQIACIAVGAAGDIYLSQYSHSVRKIDHMTGVLSLLAGSSSNSFGYTGDGGPAVHSQLHSPAGLAVDFAGNVFIADEDNNRVRKISKTNGFITTVAGNGTLTASGDGGLATAAGLSRPRALAIDRNGNMYVSDSSFSIRRVGSITGIHEWNEEGVVSIYPTLSQGNFMVHISGQVFSGLNVFDLTGRMVYSSKLNEERSEQDLQVQLDAADGMYIVQLTGAQAVLCRRIMIRK